MEKNLFHDLKAILIEYRIRFFLGFLMVLISNTLLVINPLIFRQAVSMLDPQQQIASERVGGYFQWLMGNHITSLWPWACLLITIAATSALFKYGMRVAFISVSRDVECHVRLKLFKCIQVQSRAFFDRHGIGELLSRLTNDISTYRDVLGPGIMYPLFSLTLVVPGIIALYSISPPLASLSLIPLLLIPVVHLFFRGPIYRTSKQAQKALGTMSNLVQEHYSGIRIVKSYVMEGEAFQHFSKLSSELMHLNFRLAALQGILYPFFTLMARSITLLLVLVAGMIILKAWAVLSVADFVSFMWIQSYIFYPVLTLGWVLPVYERGRAAYDRLVGLYEEPIEVFDQSTKDHSVPHGADLMIKDLTFTYARAPSPALSDINLAIKGGSFVGITGPVGAGKTTLFRLLNREYEIPRGMITLGEHDIHDYPLSTFCREIVIVDQLPFLFSKSIAENVRFGRESAPDEELVMVAKQADLHDTVLGFPKQYDTVIGERGVTLSGGQKQRVAMARAFLVNRSILLLDDIFSAVDAETERRIFSAMQANFVGKTVLLITHRISILSQLDRVIYIDGGSIIEDGAPDALMKNNGAYAALAALQQLEHRTG